MKRLPGEQVMNLLLVSRNEEKKKTLSDVNDSIHHAFIVPLLTGEGM